MFPNGNGLFAWYYHSYRLQKAKLQFSSQSLLNDHDAQRMLGFLSELDGDYSAAFMYYAKAAGGVVDGSDDSYIENVKQERETLRGWLNKWNFPVRVLNNAITTILEDYAKGGEKKRKLVLKLQQFVRTQFHV